MKIRGFLVVLMLAAVVVFFLYTLKSGGSKDIPDQIRGFDSAKQRLTETNMETLKKEILSHIISNGSPPESLDDMRMRGPLVTGKWDGWGKAIRYVKLSEEDFRLTSAGNDGIFGTADDIVKDY